MKTQIVIAATWVACTGVTALAGQTTGSKVDIVSVTGCLREQGRDNWVLVAATDPVPSIANQPPKSEIPISAPGGKNQFKLIGVSEFNLPAHKDQTVVVKGLYIKATPINRLNITSVVTAVPNCAPGAPR